MEANKILATTALAPIAWGSNYFFARHVLPPGEPVFNAAMRALPAGLLLFAVRRELPHGSWWWRTLLLGALNIGLFFVLVYIAGTHLTSGVAATIMALAPAVMMALAWPLLGERPRAMAVLGAVVGLAGVALLVWSSAGSIDLVGVMAAVAAMLTSSVGFVIGKRWDPPVSALTFTSWQLSVGGLLLLPIGLLVDGPPATVDAGQAWGYLYTAAITTAMAYVVWLRGLQLLPAGAVALVGLLNPVTGTALGAVLGGESFGVPQLLGTGVVIAGVWLGRPRRPSQHRIPKSRASACGPRARSSSHT